MSGICRTDVFLDEALEPQGSFEFVVGQCNRLLCHNDIVTDEFQDDNITDEQQVAGAGLSIFVF